MKFSTVKASLLCVLFLLFSAGNSLSAIKPQAYNFSLMGGGYSFDNNQQLETSPYYSLSVGHNINQSFTLELSGQQVPTSSEVINNDYNVWIGRVDVLYPRAGDAGGNRAVLY